MLDNMPMWLQNILLVVEIIVDLALVLYTWSTLMAYEKIKKVFTCKSCGKLNSAIHVNCDFCGKKMKQWVGVYVTFLRKRVDCKNKEEFPDFKITKHYVMRDIIMLAICVILVSLLLAMNIVGRF